MRLPPESTLGLIPWRALIVGLQVVGAFPYIVGKGDQKPRFSISLFLWSIFIHMFSLAGILTVMRFTSSYLSMPAALGSKAFFYSGCVTLVTASLSPLALMINSKKLANFLWDTGSEADIQPNTRGKWSFLVPLLVCLSMILFSLWYTIHSIKPDTAQEVIYLWVVMTVVILDFTLLMDLIEKTTSVLSQHLAAHANDILQLNATETDDKDSATLISALHALKNTGRKVEKRMGLLLDCLFPLINIYLVPGIVGAVCSSYAILNPRVPNDSPIPFLFVAYFVIFRLCRMGAHFVRQVDATIGSVRDVGVQCSSEAVQTKVREVVSELAGLQRFSVCGWYCLDYSTLLTIVSTVVTYLVIMGQVGDIPTQTHSSTSVPASS
ncbi:hypothetical protein Pcinc_023269 [Petrolisthes cinctipes]|uniref:Gustatory receptor n=1 Tax=Petrolisthes cinctipes TaxID=88211 RepID=A0AAE1FDI8_PETCI|nr:hypothetical protein Pcinc_023269 [Petrolisthes cinctipes]